jgi:hypothetical protein
MPVEQDIATQRGGPELTFDVLFPAPGNYRVWAQFLRGNKLFTVAFDVRAGEATRKQSVTTWSR